LNRKSNNRASQAIGKCPLLAKCLFSSWLRSWRFDNRDGSGVSEVTEAGFTHFRRAAETPFNMIFEARA
jgi:hypothetical protein